MLTIETIARNAFASWLADLRPTPIVTLDNIEPKRVTAVIDITRPRVAWRPESSEHIIVCHGPAGWWGVVVFDPSLPGMEAHRLLLQAAGDHIRDQYSYDDDVSLEGEAFLEQADILRRWVAGLRPLTELLTAVYKGG
jgi:hypothetical protein